MKNIDIVQTETAKRITFEVILTDYNLTVAVQLWQPEWATRPPLVTYGDNKTFIAWTRDQKVRPYLP